MSDLERPGDGEHGGVAPELEDEAGDMNTSDGLGSGGPGYDHEAYGHCGAHACDKESTDVLNIRSREPVAMDTKVGYCAEHAYTAMVTSARMIRAGEEPNYEWVRKTRARTEVG